MSHITIISAVLLAVALYSSLDTQEISNDLKLSPKVVETFKKWAAEHGKKYSSPEEQAYRMGIFSKKLQEIEELNKGDNTWTAGLTVLSDFTKEEIKAKFLIDSFDIEKSFANIPVQEFEEPTGLTQIPEIDWVKRGYAPAARQDLPTCKGSYAIASVGAIESLQKIKGIYKAPLAPQEFIDCTGSLGNYGCQGGWQHLCFAYAMSYGVSFHSNYAYTGVQGNCRMGSGFNKIGNYYKINSGDQFGALRALAAGPVPVAFDFSWGESYRTGVYTGSCSTNPSYVGLMVGSGSFNGVGYAKIQVYLGTNYGDNGYVYVQIGNCGMFNFASYPVF